jgi:hypothetical protein
LVASFVRAGAAGEIAQPEEGTVTEKNKQHYTGDDEIIQKNIERSREVIEARKQGNADTDSRVPPEDEISAPKDHREEVWDVPVGGQQNPNFGGGTAKRHKAG